VCWWSISRFVDGDGERFGMYSPNQRRYSHEDVPACSPAATYVMQGRSSVLRKTPMHHSSVAFAEICAVALAVFHLDDYSLFRGRIHPVCRITQQSAPGVYLLLPGQSTLLEFDSSCTHLKKLHRGLLK
jgi:hypothetical protein